MDIKLKFTTLMNNIMLTPMIEHTCMQVAVGLAYSDIAWLVMTWWVALITFIIGFGNWR